MRKFTIAIILLVGLFTTKTLTAQVGNATFDPNSSPHFENAFITLWDTRKPSTRIGNTNTTIALPFEGYHIKIYWEQVDGTNSGVINNDNGGVDYDNPYIITVPQAGIYRVAITGLNGFGHRTTPDKLDNNKLLEVLQWSPDAFDYKEAFKGCTNLTKVPANSPKFKKYAYLTSMFEDCTSFNSDITGWNTSKVYDMAKMFKNATSFNQDIDGWNTTKVTNANEMLSGATSFNQDVGNLIPIMTNNPYSGSQIIGMLDNSGIDCKNYSKTLIRIDQRWNYDYEPIPSAPRRPLDSSTQKITNSYFTQTLGVNGLVYNSTALVAHNRLTATTSKSNMVLQGDTYDADCAVPFVASNCDFVTLWKSDNPSTRPDNTDLSIALPLIGKNYTIYYEKEDDPTINGEVEVTSSTGTEYNQLHVDCRYGLFPSNYSNITPYILTVPIPGNYIIRVSQTGLIGISHMGAGFDNQKLLDVKQWGCTNWKVLIGAFKGCSNMQITANDTPNITTNNLTSMFEDATSFNSDITNWDTSNIMSMAKMFKNATSFNQDINQWNSSTLYYASEMLRDATSFNQYLGDFIPLQNPQTSGSKTSNMLDNSGIDCINYSKTLIKLDQRWDNSSGVLAVPKKQFITNSQKVTNRQLDIAQTLGVNGLKYNATAVGAHNRLSDLDASSNLHLQGDTYDGDCGACLWIGTNSDNWTDPANWVGGQVPAEGSLITFATNANNSNNPAVSPLRVTGNQTVSGINNGTNQPLIISTNSSLNVEGKITGSETMDKADNIVIESDGQEPNGSLIIDCASNPDPVYATVKMYSKAFKGDVTTWTDNLEDSPTKGTVFKSSYRWQYFGVPVEEQPMSPVFNGSFVREYHEYQNSTEQFYKKWADVKSTETLYAFKGYEVTREEPTTYTFKGKLNFCDKTLQMTRKAGLVNNSNGTRYGLGQNVFGNSFTSAFAVANIEFPASGIVDKAAYLYNTGTFSQWGNEIPTQLNEGVQKAGQYTAIPQNTGTVVYGGLIPSMNNFLLHFIKEETEYNEVGATVTLKYQQGAKPNSNLQTAPKKELSYLAIQLTSKTTLDDLWLFDQEGTSDAFDNGWDGFKSFGTSTAFIYSKVGNRKYQINTTDNIADQHITFYSNTDREYTLTLKKNNLEDYADLSLVDLATGIITPLSQEVTTYKFTSEPFVTSQRFKIVNKSTGLFNNLSNSDLLNTTYTDNHLVATNYTNEIGKVTLFDISGKQLFSSKMEVGQSSYNVNVPKGVYVVLLSADSKETRTKIIVK